MSRIIMHPLLCKLKVFNFSIFLFFKYHNCKEENKNGERYMRIRTERVMET